MGNDRSEFTLWQLFMGIIVIGLILCFVAYAVSNLVEGFTGNILNETTITDAAKRYVSDIESDSWKNMQEYDVYCVSAIELVNVGLLDSDASFDDGILDNDLIIVKKDKFSKEIKEVRITDKNDNDYKICKDMLPEVKYTVTFHIDNMDGNSNITKECTSYGDEGCRMKSPKIKDVTGYKIIGWNKDKNASSSNWDEDTNKLVDSNQEYYAIVIPNKIIVKYSVNGGSIVTSSNDVGKWKMNSNGIVLLNDDIFVTSINYDGSLDEYGLEDYNNVNRINISRYGYYAPSGEEWKCISGCTGTYSQSKVYGHGDFCDIDKKSCEVILGVNWKDAYTVKYNANGGSGEPSNQSKIHGESLKLSTIVPTRSGYSFVSWNTKKNGSGTSYNVGDIYNVNASITLYAQWKKDSSDVVNPTTYTVKYNANGGSGVPGSQTKIHGESLKLSSVVPIRNGYIFTNWNTKADGSGTSYNSGTNYAGNASITLYAQWKKNAVVTPTPTTYIVSYNANGGSGAPGNQTKTHDVSLVLSSVRPTRSGYTFMGWSTSSNGNGTYYNVGDTYILNANVTLYAQWMKNVVVNPTPTPTTYIVSYNANGGSGAPSSQTKTTDCMYLSSVEPTRSGYSFNGWNTSSSGSGRYYSPGTSYCGDANLTLYAQWRKNVPSSYTISYNANGGSGAPSSQSKAHDGYTYLSTVKPTRSGYTFMYWNTKADGSGLTYTPGGLYSDNKDVVFYAQWSLNSSGDTGGQAGGGTSGTTHNHTHVVNAIGSTLRTVSSIKLSCGHYHTTVLYRYCSICGMSSYNISGEGMYACPCSPVYTYIFDDSKVSSYATYKSWFGTTISSSYQLYTTSNRAKDCSAH